MPAKKCIIEVAKDGPLLVKNISNLKNSKEETIVAKDVMALCRCGASSNKPFCDGTHGKVGFSGKLEKYRSKDKRNKFKGDKVTILDNSGVCAHAGYCDGNLPKVFWTFENEKRIPHPDNASKGEIIKTIKKCPSGALSYKLNGEVYDEIKREPSIFVSKNGPLYIAGYPELKDEIGSKPDSREHYTLCRCGGSKNKPFCDGTHRYIKFKDDEN
ncbi:hypothetical protein CL615_01510 [archaeon]|jgi:CDGSH-type Zn-finger protein|nr:hypothetical protein [archaeon]MDP6547477.1 CDGSH iron-sulfur domain-containing protein [Candidatus Woesearchaeota archaeon]|tara:strand:+ start:11092 stop:11733 length:642 start_codon:yes stop_codon:yes gene_type:complete